MITSGARQKIEARWAATPLAAKGVFLVSTGSIGLVLMAALAKYLGSRLPPFEILFFRSAVGFICALWVFRSDLMEPLRTKRPGAHFFRGLVGAGGNACFFWTITHMMLADSLALQFSRPRKPLKTRRFRCQSALVARHRLLMSRSSASSMSLFLMT